MDIRCKEERRGREGGGGAGRSKSSEEEVTGLYVMIRTDEWVCVLQVVYGNPFCVCREMDLPGGVYTCVHANSMFFGIFPVQCNPAW